VQAWCSGELVFFLPADEGDHPGDGQTKVEGWVVKKVVKFTCLQGWPVPRG
jgi:hypothetical protein